MDNRGFTLYEAIVCVALIPLVVTVVVVPVDLIWGGITETQRCAADLQAAERILSEARTTLANAKEVSWNKNEGEASLSGRLADGSAFRLTAKKAGTAFEMKVVFTPKDRLAVVSIGLPRRGNPARPGNGTSGPGVELATAVYLPNLRLPGEAR